MPLHVERSIRFVAVDPGEVWCGQATLELSFDAKPFRILADSRVYHIESRDMVKTVSEIANCLPATLIVEDYRVRPVGHQRFSSGATLKMLGALELAAALTSRTRLVHVAPGNWEKEVPLLFGEFINTWRDEWTNKRDAQWRHCMSAWRILGKYLLEHHQDLLMYMRNEACHDSKHCIPRWLPFMHQKPEDRLAVAARWKLPKDVLRGMLNA